MKHKPYVIYAIVVLVTVLGLTAARQMEAVTLDPDLVTIINGLAVLVMTALFKWLSGLTGKPLTDWAAIAAASLAALIVALVNAGLSLIPGDYAEITQLLMRLVVALLAGTGLYSVTKRFKGGVKG